MIDAENNINAGMLDLESLACAAALARTLSFTRAARSRGLSAPAFGRRIAQVEEQLGRTLFLRSTRRVEIAPGAEELLARATALLEDADRLGREPSAHARAVTLTIGTRHELGMSTLMPARLALKKSAPHLHINLFFGGTLELEGAVSSLRIHGAVTSRLPASGLFEAEPLWREDYVLVASRGLLRRTPLKTLAQLAEHTILDADESLPLAGYLFRASGAQHVASVVTLGTIEAIRFAVRAGEGVAVLPRYFVAADLRSGRLVQALPRTAIAHDWFRLVFRRDAFERAALRALADALRAHPLA